ncbi:MAG: V-type ATPase 116kDa subunit family protein, partial [Candidatus Hydrothermarchaeota archaeon]|nr:V-type ATPase 116kDa subunit family protein [Candidatus Hydrothermarchaeota archaeon]
EKVEKVPVLETSPSILFKEVEDRLRITSDRTAQISSRLEIIKKEKEELDNSKATLSILQKLSTNPRDLRDYRLTRTPVGVIPSKELENLEKDIEEITKDCLLYSSKLDKQNSVVSLIFFKEHEAEIAKILRIHRFEEIQIPPRLRDYGLEEASSKIESELASIAKEEKELLKEVGEIAAKEKNKLLQIRELLKVEEFLDGASTLFGKTAKTHVLSGWVPSNQVDEVIDTIRKSSDNYCTISIEDPKKEDRPPTLLSNPSHAESVELLTNTYGSPKYGEIDPTMVMTVTFPLVFGFMFGDVGQGVLMTVLGYFLRFRLRASDAVKRLGGILILCGIAATFVGFLYGSVFGLEGEHLKHYLGFELHPLWLSPMQDIPSSIAFALRLGIVLLVLGCALNIANELMHRKYVHAIVGPYGIAGIWLLLGGVSLVTKHGVDIFGIVGDPNLIPAVVLPIFVMFMGAWRDAGLSIGMALLEAYENATRYLLNSLSFIRISIMSVVHVALSMMMVMFMDMMPATLPGSILVAGVFIGGNLAILIIETLVSFIQTLRLHFYEWFSKFYSGQGKRFDPFKVMRKYTYIEKFKNYEI